MQLQMLLRCEDREPELLKPAQAALPLHMHNGSLRGWIRTKVGSDGSQGSSRGGRQDISAAKEEPVTQ